MTDVEGVQVLTKAKLFRGLGDSSRLAVLEALRGEPRCVSEVVAETGLSQPGVSGHLACLLDCGLVSRLRKGRFVFYSIASPEVESILKSAEMALSRISGLVEDCSNYPEHLNPI
jgi:DNA-binding transcriptional ArsR family regulator